MDRSPHRIARAEEAVQAGEEPHRRLPSPYREVANAQYRYYLYYGGITDGDTIVTMFLDLADLWERAALDGTPVSAIVGDDPVEYAEDYARAYGGTQWIDKERARLIKAFDDAKKKENES